MSYALRITRTAKELEVFWERLSGVSLRLIVYEHMAGRAHCHALVVGAGISTDTMKNWIKRALDVNTFPKGDWSFKGTDDNHEKYITYMSKGTLDPYMMKGYDQVGIDLCKSRWVDLDQQLRSQKLKPEETKVKWADMLDIAEQRVRAEERHTEVMDRFIDLVIYHSKQVVYIENKSLVGRFKFRDFVDTIVARVYDGYEWGRTQKEFMRYR